MSNETKYLSQIEDSSGVVLVIRDAEAWAFIQQMGGRLEIVTLPNLPDPNGTIPQGQEHAGEKYGEFYYGKIVLTNQASSGTSNSYDEYLIRRWMNAGDSFYTYDWEKIGTTDINMAGFSAKGHVHPVDTQVGVERHKFTPEGSVHVVLTQSGTQAVTVYFDPEGTVKMEETDYTEYNGESGEHKILSYTPSGEISGSSSDAGKHAHGIGKKKKYMKRSSHSVSTGTNPTNEKLVTDTVNNFVETTDDVHKAAHITSSQNINIAHVTDPEGTTLPTIDVRKEVHLSFPTPTTDSFVKGLKTPGSGENAEVVAGAVASVIDGDPNGYYRLSFVGKNFDTDRAVTSVGQPNWGSNGTPLGSSAFGEEKIPTVENYKDQSQVDKVFSWKNFGNGIQVPKIDSTNPTKSFATGLVSNEGNGASVVTSVTDNTTSLINILSYTGELPDGYTKCSKVTNTNTYWTLPYGRNNKRVIATVKATGTNCDFIGYGSNGSCNLSVQGGKWKGTDLTATELCQVELTFKEEDNAPVMYFRVRYMGNDEWMEWSDVVRTVGTTSGLYSGITLRTNFKGEVYGISLHDIVTGALAYEGIPAKNTTNYGLYDNVGDTFKPMFESGDEEELAHPDAVPFYDNIDLSTEEAGEHKHTLDMEFEGDTAYFKSTFEGTTTQATGTTPRTVVDEENTIFTGEEKTLEHEVHNPRVYTGPDDFDEGVHNNDWYGISFDESEANPEKTRVGNMTMHKTLPIQSRMRRCLLLDDGTVNYYLDKDDSTKKSDGTEAVLTGNDGQVMVEVPKHWRNVTRDSEGIVTAQVSPYKQAGWVEVPKFYVGAYLSSLKNSKLASVSGETPLQNKSLNELRNLARNRHSIDDGETTVPDTNWNVCPYNIYLALYWLYMIEYANTNSQDAFDDSLTSEGFKKGGLGPGLTDIGTWGDIDFLPFIASGVTNNNGNKSCSKAVTHADYIQQGSSMPDSQVACYRGIEHFFGYMYQVVDGIYCNRGNMYRCDDQRHFGEDASYNSTFDGVLVSNGNIKSILIGNDGDIFPMEIGGSHNIDYYCDMYKFMSNIKCVVLSGCGYDGGKAGVGYISVGTSSDYKTVASRLCYCKQP